MSNSKPEWDEAFGDVLMGALVLVGITREGRGEASNEQVYGKVVDATEEGIVMLLQGARTGEYFHLPPDPSSFFPAQAGVYHLRSTGEAVKNPDYIATWTVSAKG